MRTMFFQIAVILLVALMAGVEVSAKKFSDWSAPVNLGPGVNSAASESAAVLTNNGRTLFFTSNRSGTFGDEDLWVITRRNRNAEWGEAVNLGPIVNSGSMDRLRSISPDGRILLFQSNRPGGEGGNDIWASVRKRTHDDLGWSVPVNLGNVINTSTNEVAANYLFDTLGRGHKLFFSSQRSGGVGSTDIYVSDIPPGGEFGTPQNVFELNSVYHETCFWIRDDGLELIFSSTRDGFNNDISSFDLWASSRADVKDSWSAPEKLNGGINTAGVIEVNPQLSDGGETMIFTSGRPGGYGGTDIYMTQRRRINSKN